MDSIEVILNKEVSVGINKVLKNVDSSGVITMSIEINRILFISHRASSFMICEVKQENSFIGIYNIPVEILNMLMNKNKMSINVGLKNILFKGYNEINDVVINLDCIKDNNIDYYSNDIRELHRDLGLGVGFKDFPKLKEFEKIAKLGVGGLLINNGVCYTDGDGFKFFSYTDIRLNCLLNNEGIKNLIDFSAVRKDEKDSKLIEVNNTNDYLICRYSNLTMGIRLSINKHTQDFENIIKSLPVNYSVDLNVKNLKYILGNYKSSLKDTTLEFNLDNNFIMINNKYVKGKLNIITKDLTGGDKEKKIIKVSFSLIKQLLNVIDYQNEFIKLTVYDRFILLNDNLYYLFLTKFI